MWFFNRHGTRSHERRKARQEFWVILTILGLIALLFAGMMLLTRVGPRLEEDPLATARASFQDPANPLSAKALEDARAQVFQLSSDYQEEIKTSTDPIQSLQLIEEAITIQQKILLGRSTEIASQQDLELLNQLRTIRDREMGTFLAAKASELRLQAEQAQTANDFDAATAHLEAAIQTYRDIARSHPLSTEADARRLTSLENELRDLRAQPLKEQSQEARDRAFRLLEIRDYSSARTAMARALEQQKELYEKYRSSRHASLGRLKAFERDLHTIMAGELIDNIRTHETAAREALAKDELTDAAIAIEQAINHQQQLAARHPDTADAQPARREQLLVLKETIASIPLMQATIANNQELTKRLQSGDLESISMLVAEKFRNIQQMHRNYPRSIHTQNTHLGEAEYLNNKRLDLATLHHSIRNHLIRLPGDSGRQMLNREVWQSLYEQVMDTNPSNQKGALLPVESVTIAEAQEFCRRASWILGRTIRLPDAATFRAAVGDVRSSMIGDESWHSNNSDRSLQPVATRSANSNGFYDLVGNVAEWVAEPLANDFKAVALGGSIRDNPMRLASLPEENREWNERNRFIGFRILVEP